VASGKRQRFTYDEYRKFLAAIRASYRFTTFREGKSIADHAGGPLVILRHDVDMGLEPAIRMALIEQELGIRSTYFFMVSCPLYSVFSRRGAEEVRLILGAGHGLGLHFDCAVYGEISADCLDDRVSRECQLLETYFGRAVEAVSFHRPGELELSGPELKMWPNSYEMVFREKFKYFSDSRGEWAYGHPLDSEAFRAGRHLHLCIHPVWWTTEPRTPAECLTELAERIASRLDEYLSDNSRVWNTGRMPRPGDRAAADSEMRATSEGNAWPSR